MKVKISVYDDFLKIFRYHTIKIKNWENFIHYVDNYKNIPERENIIEF